MRRCLGCLVALFCLFDAGCLVSGSRQRVIRQNEPLASVQFESQAAQQAFLSRALDDGERKSLSSSSSFGIPFLVGYSQQTVMSPNAFYNDCVARCDANHDGVITESEAAALNGGVLQRAP